MSGFFVSDACLLKPCDRRAHHEGHFAHRVSDDQKGGWVFDGVEKGEEFPFKAHGKITKGHDKTRHGQGEHRHRVEEVSSRELRANDNIGDAYAQEAVEHRCRACVNEAVLNRGNGERVAQGNVVILQRPASWQ